MKRMTVIGRGTAGALSIIHFLTYTDWELDWRFDDNISPQSVGEGSFPNLPEDLSNCMYFTYDDLDKVDGTLKFGIHKINWGGTGNYKHYFYGPNVGYHFNASKLQETILDFVRNNRRVRLINDNVTDHSQIDSNHIMDCSGRPASFEKYHMCQYIPVNSVHVTQCFWDASKFNYTLTIARPYGWVFGIPLQNRCSIGYLYNSDITSIDDIKEDVKEIFKEYGLNPSDNTNSFKFSSYHRLNNYSNRVSYNGNSSFFLEPLEATSISMMSNIKRRSYDLFNNTISPEEANNNYLRDNCEVERMIMLHYLAGSKFDTEFWKYAKSRAEECIKFTAKDKNFIHMINNGMNDSNYAYGFWKHTSYKDNLAGLGLTNIIPKIIWDNMQTER